MPMHPRERLAYSPIEGRPPLKFPDGVRLVVWPVLALEEWDMAPADGAHGDLAAAGPADAARPSELELARIRHARRLLAAAQDVAQARHRRRP